jgi:hypothetical protein
MSKVLQRLNVLAVWLLGSLLASVLVAPIWPGAPLLAGIPALDKDS